VFADTTGIVVVPAERYDEVLVIAREIDRKDREFAEALQAGGNFADIARSLGHL
jgi:regulator of RNase E activity RraA